MLTRTVPGQEPKSVRPEGPPFHWRRLRAGQGGHRAGRGAGAPSGQVGGGQTVSLFLEPEGTDLAGMLPARRAAVRSGARHRHCLNGLLGDRA